MESISFSQWKAQIEANVFMTINMTKAVLPYMRKQRNGKIINISSVNGRLAMPAFAPYATSKFAIEGFSEALRSEMLPFNVYVSLIEPGSYPTEIWDRGFALMAKQHEQDYIMLEERIMELAKHSAASKRNPMEVAHLICKIASTKKPKLRYPVSFSDRLMVSVKNWLPWSWLELLIKNILKTSKKQHKI